MRVADTIEARRAAPARPPRPMAWVLLLASAAAVLLVGIAATAVVFLRFAPDLPAATRSFAAAFAFACVLTLGCLAIRGLRWVFLLRRASTRIPIRDAYIGYFAGFSLLFAPFLVGEIAVRALVLRARGRVPVATVVAVNLWERLLDVAALSAIVAVAGLALGRYDALTGAAAGVVVALALAPVRHAAVALVGRVAHRIGAAFDRAAPPPRLQFALARRWWGALGASILAWLLPGIGLLALVRAWGQAYGLVAAEYDYASSSSIAAAMLAPGGVLVAGGRWLDALEARGLPPALAALSVAGVRFATVGVAIALGCLVLLLHARSRAADPATHFDDIADAYDVQIAEGRRLALLDRKTQLMREVLEQRGRGSACRGLDVGCGQGAYVARMREFGFDTAGIDASAGQVEIASRRLEESGLVRIGSTLDIPAADGTFDFVYTINVLHHLASIDEQRIAFRELFRVLRPGGILFVHEINTRNVLFRFYMGYVFPSLNCIDEGIERWLLPTKLSDYTDVPLDQVRYFTFFPDFLPETVVRWLSPIERWLEGSALAPYSAHYLAVWRKP